MEIIKLKDFMDQKEYFIRHAEKGKIYIYPTDSVYGIWAIYNQENINKIAKIKNRDPKKPVSIIAPNWGWIWFNFSIDVNELKSKFEENNPCTFILETEDDFDLPSFNKSLGVRIINHPFQDFVNQLWQAFITTSVNLAGEKNIKNIKDISKEILSQVDFVIDDGILDNSPSILINMITDKIIKR